MSIIHHTKTKGFTLIELLVVIVIIGLLAGIGIASFQGSLQKGRDSVRLSTVKEVKDAVIRYWVDNGNYPGTTHSYVKVVQTAVVVILLVKIPTAMGFRGLILWLLMVI